MGPDDDILASLPSRLPRFLGGDRQQRARDPELEAEVCDVRKCCSASISVGAISAAWWLFATARSSA